MKTRENIAKILSDIITDNPNDDTLDIAEAMYRMGFYDGVNSEQERELERKTKEKNLPPYYGN